MFNINEPLPPITLTVVDLMAIDALLIGKSGKEKDPGQIADYLERELNRAHVVPEKELPHNIVRMRSRVTYRTNMLDEPQTITLVYPHEADIDAGKVSVLTPIGAALIGMAAGKNITYYTPSGGAQTLTVVAVLRQLQMGITNNCGD